MATSWHQLWRQLSDDERAEAMALYVSELASGPERRSSHDKLLKKLAKALRFRPKMVATLDEPRVCRYLIAHAERVMDHARWGDLFSTYYFTHRIALMCAFLDGLGIPHDRRGLVDGEDWNMPGDDVVRAAIRTLASGFPARQIAHYLDVLRLRQPSWRFVEAAIGELERVAERPDSDEAPPPGARDEYAPVLDDFTTLDRVLIDQVVAAVSGTEGALSPDALEDLILTVVELNPRPRSLFHLGMMDGLLHAQASHANRPEANDERRAWYLAGALAAKARQRDAEGLRDLLAAHEAAFGWAASRAGGAGAVMANLVLEFLLECGRHAEALALLRGQLEGEQIRLARTAYGWATRLVRGDDIAAAMPILNALQGRIDGLALGELERAAFKLEIDRRLGQCLQAQGRFERATELFEGILDRVPGRMRPDVLADLGLVSGGFRSLGEIRLPQDEARRRELGHALLRGEARFTTAVEEHGADAPNAAFALAVLRYLQYADGDTQSDNTRVEALDCARLAIEGMVESPSAGAYEAIGVLGRARFVAVVTHLEGLPEGEARVALRQWEQITEAAGEFPLRDLERLLRAAELLDTEVAVQLAESMWHFRGRDVLEVLSRLGAPTVARSTALVEALLEEARSAETPTPRRYRLLKCVAPVLIEMRRSEEAEEVLDALETIATEIDRADDLAAWLETPSNYDPAWSRQDAEWARVRLARAAGRDAECAALLEWLFFRYRDEDADAARQIALLLRDWNLDANRADELIGILPADADARLAEVDDRLREGAEVEVLFVGGNETQARYDDRIREELSAEWPRVRVQFEHTGWSPNWGRELPRLQRRAGESDVVVLTSMMRTLLGRRLRAGLTRPWVACTGTGKDAMLASIRRAARLGAEHRERTDR